MRAFIVFTLLITICFQNLHAQNLVPNPSFEDTVNCNGPWNCCSIEIAYPWFNPNTATSDLFTSFPSCGLPTSLAEQTPRTGFSFAGIYGYSGSTREYIEIPLIDSLISGYGYCLSFYFTRSEMCHGAIDRLGAFFSMDSLISTSPTNFNVIPNIETPAGILLYDTSGWQLISGIYYASGGEKFLTIGNFRDNNQTQYTVVDSVINSNCNSAYYGIDDVSLLLCDSTSGTIENLMNQIQIDLYDYHENNNIILKNLKSSCKYFIFDITGKLVAKGTLNSSNNIIFLGRKLNSNMYILKIESKNYNIIKKLKL